jgi:hypothetical protein
MGTAAVENRRSSKLLFNIALEQNRQSRGRARGGRVVTGVISNGSFISSKAKGERTGQSESASFLARAQNDYP